MAGFDSKSPRNKAEKLSRSNNSPRSKCVSTSIKSAETRPHSRTRSISPEKGDKRSTYNNGSSRHISVGETESDKLQYSRGVEQQNDDDDDSIEKIKASSEAVEKLKFSFKLSGKLAVETNRYRGATLLFNEPSDARKPDVRWRLYVFKGREPLDEPLCVHRQSCYVFGSGRRVVDIPTDHSSCSKQHAVLQYRQVEENEDGTMCTHVRPYLMDLGSTNGTFLNNHQLEPHRYYELLEKDSIKFGNSSRKYVILHEDSVAA